MSDRCPLGYLFRSPSGFEGERDQVIRFFYFFSLTSVLQPVKIIYFVLSQVNHKVGQKREIPEKKNNLTTHKQNLACLTCDPS